MDYRRLGRTDVNVSSICLGTMTWGTQNTEAEAHEQMDYAVGAGVNFFDTAEMYPTTPLGPETQGRTEEIIGTWFAARGQRDDIVLATKVTGDGIDWVRGGEGFTPANIRAAVEGSLARLQTDYIDLYQLHWPNRGSYHFRKYWQYDPTGNDPAQVREDMAVTLRTLGDLVAEGKIRHVGLSNESAWGTAEFLKIAAAENLPRVVSIQNEYSLLCRIYDTDLAELTHYEDVGLLAFTPLAAGLLTGKYQGGAVPEGSRKSLRADLGGRVNDGLDTVIGAYQAVADKHGLSLTQLSLAFAVSRPFMASVIIGATTMDQLRENIAAKDILLTEAMQDDIAAVHRRHPMPI